MIYSTKYEFVYFPMPKTGSTTISTVLIEKYGGTLNHDRHDNRVPTQFKNYFKFTTVRNPYKRAISGYSHVSRKLGDNLDFQDYFLKFHLVPMTTYLTYEFKVEKYATVFNYYKDFMNGKLGPGLKLDAILTCENLENDFKNLYFTDKKDILDKKNKSSSSEVDPKVMKRLCCYVAANYVEDFKNFGYRLDDINIDSNWKFPLFC